MALTGNAFLAMWHDIEPSRQAEYTEWHTREHMPERLSIPGFTVGKRLINHGLDRYRYGTIYAGESLEVFRSPAYLERLNDPTTWSTGMQPAFRNFLRVACERLASAGIGDGGAMATVRLDFTDASGASLLAERAGALAEALLALRGVACAHVGLARSEVSGVRTRETELRPGMKEREFDVVVLVEGSGQPELEAIVGEIEAVVTGAGCGLTNPQTVVYALAYQLAAAQTGARP